MDHRLENGRPFIPMQTAQWRRVTYRSDLLPRYVAKTMDIIKDGPRTGKWPPIHSYANCSVAHGNIQERFASAVCGQDT